MRRETILIILILLTTFIFGKELPISGYVVNENNQGIEQVLVKSPKGFSLSGNNGEFKVPAADNDSILFHKLGYKDVSIAARNLPVRITLQKSAVEISGRKISGKLEAAQQNIRRIKIDKQAARAGKSAAEQISGSSNLLMKGSRLAGSHQSLSIPGYDSRHTLVLLDGIPLNRAGEEFDLSRIPVSIISEIEIIPGSAEAGSGGMGSVLNLVTRKAEEAAFLQGSFCYGSYEYYGETMNLSREINGASLGVNVAYRQAENDFCYPVPENWVEDQKEVQRTNNSFRQLDLSSYVKKKSELSELDLKMYYTNFMRMLPGAINSPELFYQARLNGEIWKLQARWQYRRQKLLASVAGWLHDEKTIYDNTRLQEPYNNYLIYYKYGINRSRTTGVKPIVKWHLSDKMVCKLGIEAKQEAYEYRETTKPENSIAEVKRFMAGIFTEELYEREFGRCSGWLKLSARYDRAEEFAGTASGSISGGIRQAKEGGLRVDMGRLRGYTLPSFYSLYWKGDAEAVGNPQLQPESSDGWQANIGYQYSFLDLEISWRSDEITDKIIWLQTFNGAWKPLNIAAAQVTNLQYSLNLTAWQRLTVTALYNKTLSADKTRLENNEPSAFYDKELIYTPEYQGNLKAEWSLSRWTMGTEMEFTGSQWTTRDQLVPEKRLAAYELYNCWLGFRFRAGACQMELSMRINNIMDDHYYVYDYMPQPGRNYKINLNIRR